MVLNAYLRVIVAKRQESWNIYTPTRILLIKGCMEGHEWAGVSGLWCELAKCVPEAQRFK